MTFQVMRLDDINYGEYLKGNLKGEPWDTLVFRWQEKDEDAAKENEKGWPVK